jgi:hypothetical protein
MVREQVRSDQWSTSLYSFPEGRESQLSSVESRSLELEPKDPLHFGGY